MSSRKAPHRLRLIGGLRKKSEKRLLGGVAAWVVPALLLLLGGTCRDVRMVHCQNMAEFFSPAKGGNSGLIP